MQANRRTQIIQALKGGPMVTKEISDAIKCSKEAARRELSDMVRSMEVCLGAKLLRSEGQHRWTSVYYLPEQKHDIMMGKYGEMYIAAEAAGQELRDKVEDALNRMVGETKGRCTIGQVASKVGFPPEKIEDIVYQVARAHGFEVKTDPFGKLTIRHPDYLGA